VEIDWSDVRVICIAPGYKKYDLHAVQVMGANIELWQYKLYSNDVFSLEEVFRRHEILFGEMPSDGKNPTMVAAGKKAAKTRLSGQYSVEEHFKKAGGAIGILATALRDCILQLGDDVDEAPRKYHIAYKVAQNFASIEIQKSKVLLYLKLNPTEIKDLPAIARDVRKIGHYGTGDLELKISKRDHLELAGEYVKQAYERIGG